MEISNLSFEELLQHIDHLRSKGMSDSSPELSVARERLRQLLASRKSKEQKSNKVVPVLVASKTLTLSALPEPVIDQKYLIIGLVVGILVVIVSLWKRNK